MNTSRDNPFRNPTEEENEALPRDLRAVLRDAGDALRELREASPSGDALAALISTEARASANIESEFDPGRIRLHDDALSLFLKSPGNEPDLLELHGRMLAGQRHAEPGRYRSVKVTIGGYLPPAPALVPAMMTELFKQAHGPTVTTAVWTHLQFENIHPFADGNGRTGRALMQSAMGVPLPISQFILRERPRYYELFRKNDWQAWLNWFCEGILEECTRIRTRSKEAPPR